MAIEHNIYFLKAVQAFTSGEEKTSQALEEFMEENPPSAEDQRWVLNIFRQGAKEDTTQINCENFTVELKRLMEKIDTPPPTQDSVQLDAGGEGAHYDQGMRKTRKSSIMKESDPIGEKYQQSAGISLYDVLSSQGWLSSWYMQKTGVEHSSRKLFVKGGDLAKEHGIPGDICAIPVGRLTYIMMSPTLAALYQQRYAKTALLERQPGERVQSLFNHVTFKQLVAAISEQMEKTDHLTWAINKRKSGANNALCLSVPLQHVLQELGIIIIKSDNPNNSVGVPTHAIPEDPQQLKALAERIAEDVRSYISKHPEHTPPVASPSIGAREEGGRY